VRNGKMFLSLTRESGLCLDGLQTECQYMLLKSWANYRHKKIKCQVFFIKKIIFLRFYLFVTIFYLLLRGCYQVFLGDFGGGRCEFFKGKIRLKTLYNKCIDNKTNNNKTRQIIIIPPQKLVNNYSPSPVFNCNFSRKNMIITILSGHCKNLFSLKKGRPERYLRKGGILIWFS